MTSLNTSGGGDTSEQALTTARLRQLSVTSPALGCMGLSGAYGPIDEVENRRVINTYLDAGGNLLDTGDFYAAGHNELLVGDVLRHRRREEVVLSVKFGALLTPSGAMAGFDGRPAAVRNSLSYSLRRLGTDYVDIYRPARLDPAVPIEETIGAVAELVEQGYVRQIGLSEVGAETIRRAAAVAPIGDLQIEYSLLSRGIEDEILPTCRELGIGITAYGVLSKGLISGKGLISSSGSTDGRRDNLGSRAAFPRFQGENLTHNHNLIAGLQHLANSKQTSVAQLAIAWVAAQGEDIVPVVGARRTEQIESMINSNRVRLDTDDLETIGQLIPRDAVRGDRYPAQHMAMLDSER